MKTIYKFPVVFNNEYTGLHLSPNAKIRHFGMQGSSPTLWIEVDNGMLFEKRYFKIFGTGHELKNVIDFVGTTFDGPFVWHCYEVTP